MIPPFAAMDPFSIDAFRERAGSGLLNEAPTDAPLEQTLGDHRLTPGGFTPHKNPRAAAVLVPVIPRPDGATVLFTLRSPDLPRHAGQISFPGGRMDPTDADLRDTALREAEEEIGLDRSFVQTLGYLDVYLSAGGFRVVPVVGLVDPAATFTMEPREVAEIFEVPLSHLMTPDNYFMETGIREGIWRRFYVTTYEERIIWGITAGILRNLHDRLYAE